MSTEMSGNQLFKQMKDEIIAYYLALTDETKKKKFWESCQQTAIDLEQKYKIDLLGTFKNSEDDQANYFVTLLEKETDLADRKKLGKALFKVIFLAEIYRRLNNSNSQEPKIAESTQEIVHNQLEQAPKIVEQQTIVAIETLDSSQAIQTPLRDILVESVFNAIIDVDQNQNWQGSEHPLFMYLLPELKQQATYPDMPNAFLLGVDEYLDGIKNAYPVELHSSLFENTQESSYFTASKKSMIASISTQIKDDLTRIAQHFENTFLTSYSERKTDVFQDDTYVKAILVEKDEQGQSTYTPFLKKLGSFLAAREDLLRFKDQSKEYQGNLVGSSEQANISETIDTVSETQTYNGLEVLAQIAQVPITTITVEDQELDAKLLDYKRDFQYYFMELTNSPEHFGLFFYKDSQARTPFSGLILPIQEFGVSTWQEFKAILEKNQIIPNYVVATALETKILANGTPTLGEFLATNFDVLSTYSLIQSVQHLHKAIFGENTDLNSISPNLISNLNNLQTQGQILAVYEMLVLEQISLETISEVRENPKSFENLTIVTFLYQNRIYFYDRHLNYRLLVVSNPLSQLAVNTEQYPQTLEINTDQSLNPIKILSSTCEDHPFVQEFLQGLSNQITDALPDSPTLKRLQANVLGHLTNPKLRIFLTTNIINRILTKLDLAKQKALKFFESAEYFQKGYLSVAQSVGIEDPIRIKTTVLQYYKEQLYVQTTIDQRDTLRFIVFSKFEKANATLPRIHLSFEISVGQDTFSNLFPLKTSFTPSVDYLFDLENSGLLQEQSNFVATFRLSDLVVALQSLDENACIDFSAMLIGTPPKSKSQRFLETIGFLKFQTNQISIFIESHLEDEIPYIDLDTDQ